MLLDQCTRPKRVTRNFKSFCVRVCLKNTLMATSLFLLLVIGLDVATSYSNVASVHTRSKPAKQHMTHCEHAANAGEHLKLHKPSPNDSGVSAMLRNMSVFAPSPPRLRGGRG